MIRYLSRYSIMKFNIAVSLLIFPFLLSSCGNNPAPVDSGEDATKVNVSMPAMMNDKALDYNLSFNYKDSYFEQSATVFSKDLMLLSFASTITSRKVEYAQRFFNDIGYDIFYASPDYATGTTENTIGFVFAHKEFEGFDLVAISIRGYDYNQEWANNFEVGAEGDHVGFMASTNRVFTLLQEYLSQFSTESIKFWVSGYSRAGGVANVLSYKLMTSKEIEVSKDNLFTYTFEAPRALTQEHAIAYENVFNIVNPTDFIARLLPTQYGLYRCGIDKEIYSDKIDEYLSNFDKNIVLEKFQASEGSYTTPIEFTDYILSELLKKKDSEEYNMLHDRENYLTIQNYLRYTLNLIMSIPNYTTVLSDKISKMSKMDIMLLLSDDGTNLYNFIKPILDENNISYVDEELRSTCSTLLIFVKRYISTVMSIAMTNNGKRMIKMHMPEAIYVLIKNY